MSAYEETERQSKFSRIPLDKEQMELEKYGFTGVFNIPQGGCADAILSLMKTGVRIFDRKLYEKKHKNDDSIPVEEKGLRTLTWGDFMILNPYTKKLSEYMRLLREKGIPFRCEGESQFSKCPVLQSLSNVFSAIAEPGEPLRVYTALRDKLFGIREHDLIRLRNSGKRLNLYSCNEEDGEENAAIASAVKVLHGLVFKAQSMSAAAACALIMDTLAIEAKVSAENLEYAYYALELLRAREESSGFASPAEAAQFLRGIASDESDTDRCLSLRQDADRVLLTNLHKVKGLEAPVVILEEPRCSVHEPGHSTLIREDDTFRTYRFSMKEYKKITINTDNYKKQKEHETLCSDAEGDRLLYVAATRARNILLITDGKETADKINPWKPLLGVTEGDLEKFVPPVAEGEEEAESGDSAEKLRAEGEEQCVIGKLIKKSYDVVTPSRLTLKTKAADYEEDENDDVAIAGQSIKAQDKALLRNAALLGTLAHRVMELLVLTKNSTPTDALVDCAMNEQEISPSEVEKLRGALAAMVDTIRGGGYPQTDGAPRDILSVLLNADEVHCELPFGYNNGTVCHGIIDVVYHNESGWHIVDYKTNFDARHLADKYEAQLAAYKAAFRELTGETADAKIYHVGI